MPAFLRSRVQAISRAKLELARLSPCRPAPPCLLLIAVLGLAHSQNRYGLGSKWKGKSSRRKQPRRHIVRLCLAKLGGAYVGAYTL